MKATAFWDYQQVAEPGLHSFILRATQVIFITLTISSPFGSIHRLRPPDLYD
jgi:hypothetical protein